MDLVTQSLQIGLLLIYLNLGFVRWTGLTIPEWYSRLIQKGDLV